ncbi:MAG: hypothetical protein KDD92_13710 [Caldilineaceae bacterium]|nr:hypothetical protein [Caldilineaceae bacterium]
MKQDGIERLEAKTAGKAIVEKLQSDFNVSKIVVRTLFEQMQMHFENFYDQKKETRQLRVI